MEQSEIIKGNKLIAEFMNFKFLTQKEYAVSVNCPKEELTNMPICNCFYHSSWDWLMPVVDKIDTLVKNKRTFIEHIDGEWWTNLDYNAYYNSKISKIDSVYNAVIMYIKQYNKNNK